MFVQIYSDSLMSIGFTSTSTCFIFTCGDCSAVYEIFRLFASGGPSVSSVSSLLLPLVSTPLGVLPSLVYGPWSYCILCLFRSSRNFCFLRTEKRLSVSSVFKFHLLELHDSFILRDLVHSFELERPRCPPGPPAWDLVKVLEFLRCPT